MYASSMSSDLNKPSFIVDETEAWSPMVRSGSGWDHWVEIDLLNVLRINGLSFIVPNTYKGSLVRKINKLKLQYSNVPGVVIDLEEIDLSAETRTTIVRNFTTAVNARFLRISISELKEEFETAPLVVHG